MIILAMKKTLKLGFGRLHQLTSICSLTISSSYVNIKLHTGNQPTSFVNTRDSYEEDFKIMILKMTL